MSEPSSPLPPKALLAIPISWKLLGATVVVGAVAALIAIIGLKRIQTLNQNLTQTVDFLATNVTLASLIRQDLVTITRAQENMISARSDEEMKRFDDVVFEVLTAMDQRLAELHGIVAEEDQRQLDQLSDKLARWQENHIEVRRFAGIKSSATARIVSLGKAREAIDRMDKALIQITMRLRKDLDAARQDKSFEQSAALAESLSKVEAVATAALRMQRAEKNLLLAPTEEEMLHYEESLVPLSKDLQASIDALLAAIDSDDSAAVKQLEEAQLDYLAENQRLQKVAAEKSNFLAYQLVYESGSPLATECEAILDNLITHNEQQMQVYRQTSQQSYTSARNVLMGISILGIVVSVGISFYTGHRIASRLSMLSRYANTIQSTGDLSRPAPQLGRDEVGLLAESFEKMRQSLHEHTENLSDKRARLAEMAQTLRAKNKEMEQFVYTVSHDLKSPLVSCKGLLGILKEDVADGDYEAVLDSANRLDLATDQLNQIIDDLLMLSRIGKKPLQRTAVDMNALMHELTDELASRIADANAEVQVNAGLPEVFADASDVRRIFENLITNALKYGTDGTIARITIGGSRVESEVRLFVQDNGQGIDPKYHERVFALFQRLDTQQPGTGLGLASVAKIMDMHGGRVWVESEIGQGATFWVAFPVQTKRS